MERTGEFTMSKGFTQYAIRYVDAKTMNKILKEVKKYPVVYSKDRIPGKPFSVYSYIHEAEANLHVTTKFYSDDKTPSGKIIRYVLYKPTGEIKHVSNPMVCYKTLHQYYKEHNIFTDENSDLKKYFYKAHEGSRTRILPSASPLTFVLPKYDNKYIPKVYEYDLNSAYAAVLNRFIPDTTKYRKDSKVKKGEIGFMLNDEQLLLAHEGQKAQLVFPLIESPFKEYIARWYEVKSTTKNKEEKQKAKDMLNIVVGYMQKSNPFIRAYVVNTCNEFMYKLIDENTVYINTDAIFSTVPRPELELGTGLGQFKLEYEGWAMFRGGTYQTENKVAYRGTPASWFGKDFNLLKDDRPINSNDYVFDSKSFKVVRKKEKRVKEGK